MVSIYIGQLVRPIVTPIAMRIRSYQRGGAIVTLQEHRTIRTIASAGKNSDLLRVPLPAAMFVVNWRNRKFHKAFSDIEEGHQISPNGRV